MVMCVYTHTMSMKQTRVNVIERRLCVVEQKQREEKRRERGGRGILLCIYAYGGVVCVFVCLFVCVVCKTPATYVSSLRGGSPRWLLI